LKAGIGMKMTVMAWEGRMIQKMLQLLLRELVRAGENWLAFIFGTGWKINLELAGFYIWYRLVFILFP
jgi:hypothetical protein